MSVILKYILFFSLLFFALSSLGYEAWDNERLCVERGLSNDYVHGIVEDSRGRVWIATESGLNCYDGYGYKVFKTYNSSLKSNFINCLYRDRMRKQILVGVKGYGLYSIDESSGMLKDITPKGRSVHNVMAIKAVKGGSLRLFCPEKVITFQPGERDFQRVSKIGYNGMSLLPSSSKVYTDPFGNRWTATLGMGVTMSRQKHNPFTCLVRGSVHSVELDKNCVWVGGDDVLYRIDKQRRLTRIPLVYGNVRGHILSVCCYDEHKLLLAVGGCLLCYDVTAETFNELRYQGRSVRAITFFNDDRTGVVWVTALDGIYSLRNGKLVREDRLNSFLRHQQSNGLRVDDEGKIWIGTYEDGMYLFGKDKRLLHHYTQQEHFFTNSVMHLRLGSKSRLWLATPDGIGLFDTRRPQSFRSFGFKQGLSDPFIRGVADTGDGNAWVTTNNGLAYFDGRSECFYNFNRYDGVPASNITGGILLLPDGNLMFTTMGGLYLAETSRLLHPGHISPVTFTGCEVRLPDSHQTNTKMIAPDNDGGYILKYNENSFVLTFSVMDKSQCRRTDYSYRIKGLADEWTATDGNKVSVTGLPSGNYLIEVRARLHGQPWSKASMASVRLVIAYPWWKSIPARIAYVLLGIAFFVLGVNWYKRRLKEKSDLLFEKKMVEAEKARNTERLQFFTNVAHELRTPLTLIFGPVKQLEQSKTLGVDEQRRLGLIKSSAQRLLTLINQLMDFRKAETHNKKLKVSYGSLNDLVAKVGNEFVQGNSNPEVKIKVKVSSADQKQWFDADMITTILNNLLSNAVKNTVSGEIRLSLDEYVSGEQTFTRIRVADTGCGIPEEALPHIFDRYFRVEGQNSASGTGIGLALVKALCDLHKMSISVESRVGKGTVFSLLLDQAVTFPDAYIVDPAHDQTDSDDRRGEYALRGECCASDADQRPVMLIVEDNIQINNYVAENFAQDFAILQAVNGKDGLEKARENGPDVIITDIMMPVMDGIAMTRRLKSDMATSHIPVIMLTAKTEDEDQKEGYENGADSYLTKPFTIDMLRVRVNNILVARKKLAQHILEMTKDKGTEKQDTCDTRNDCRQLSRLDSQFLNRLNEAIQSHLSDSKLNLATIADEIGVSQSTLYRKTKALTGVSTNEYIRKIRLEHCRRLMSDGTHNVSQAAFQSGFTDLAFFRSQFKQEYGLTPNEYLRGTSRG